MRLLNWLRRGALEHDLERELQYHLQRRVADLTQSGLSESDARARAAREIGGLAQVREEVRDVWLTRWLRDFAYDLRFSARSVLHTPSFTATAVLSLALGIGATTAICSLVDQVILHELPVRDPGRLVLIDWKGIQLADTFGSWNLMSYPLCRDLQQHEEVFDGVFCRALTTVTLSMGEEHTPVSAELVSGTYFSVLGVGPALGRVVQADDDQTPDARAVVVLAYDYWKTQLASAPDVVGRKILINQHPMTIVGVAAAGFRGIDVGEVPSLWIPASMAGQAIPSFTDLLNRRTRWVQILGRLRPDVTLAQAQAALQPWFKAMLEEDTRAPRGVPDGHGGAAAALSRVDVGAHARPPGPFVAQTSAVEAIVGAVRGDCRTARPRVLERRGTVRRARIGARARDQHAPGARRVARTNRPAAARGQRAAVARRRTAGASACADGDADAHRVSSARHGGQCARVHD
jgi:hypothetical protein